VFIKLNPLEHLISVQEKLSELGEHVKTYPLSTESDYSLCVIVRSKSAILTERYVQKINDLLSIKPLIIRNYYPRFKNSDEENHSRDNTRNSRLKRALQPE